MSRISNKIHKVTIIVPVYGDWSSLKDCIISLKKHVNNNIHKVVFVNDCGPEVDTLEVKILDSIKNIKNFQYHRNEKNLGFVGTCNRAVNELDKSSNDILLLNSDTEVTEGFLETMLGVLYESSKHGCVSPRSNNATIATIPISAAKQRGINKEASYTMYRKMKKYFPPYFETPVAHGFCMLIRRSIIKEYGLFDPIFKKGYGEEVDFCMRIKDKGYKSLLANHAYVFHLEARSFSIERKMELIKENHKIIDSRYPDYGKIVRDYMNKALIREAKIERRAGILKIRYNVVNFLKKNKQLAVLLKRKIRSFFNN